MSGKRSTNARSVLRAEVAAIRRRDPDLDAVDLTVFTVPLLVRAVGVLALGAIPLLVIRSSSNVDSLLVPVVGSLALVIICTAVVAWLLSIVISGVVVMVLYRTGPAAASHVVTRVLGDSFGRISNSSSELTLAALIAGLLSLAIGLPTRADDDLANSVIDDLLAAQIGVLVAVLGVAFVAESIRSSADVVDDQSLMLAWPWSLLIASLSWMLATMIGPFESTRMLTILLNEWLPAMVDGTPRTEIIAGLVPAHARLWAALGPLPVIALIWAITAWRHQGFVRIREFLGGQDEVPATRLK